MADDKLAGLEQARRVGTSQKGWNKPEGLEQARRVGTSQKGWNKPEGLEGLLARGLVEVVSIPTLANTPDSFACFRLKERPRPRSLTNTKRPRSITNLKVAQQVRKLHKDAARHSGGNLTDFVHNLSSRAEESTSRPLPDILGRGPCLLAPRRDHRPTRTPMGAGGEQLGTRARQRYGLLAMKVAGQLINSHLLILRHSFAHSLHGRDGLQQPC
jgi:hypothetical protein